MLKLIKTFFKKPSEYINQCEKMSVKKLIPLLIFFVLIKLTFDTISPHDFPKDFSFETAQIISPSSIEFLTSYLLSFFISFFVFVPLTVFYIKYEVSILKVLLYTLIFAFMISIPFFLKGFYIIFVFLVPSALWFLIIRKNTDIYTSLVKIIISMLIISIIAEPFMYLSETLKSDFIFTTINLIFAMLYIIYFIKLMKTRFDLSVLKIFFYSIASVLISVIYGFLIYYAHIFPSNIIKLLIY